jgi:hypothetical protein
MDIFDYDADKIAEVERRARTFGRVRPWDFSHHHGPGEARRLQFLWELRLTELGLGEQLEPEEVA